MCPSFHVQVSCSWLKNWHQQQVGVTEAIGLIYESVGVTVGTFRPYTSYAHIYWLLVHMRGLIGVLMWMIFTVFKAYSMSTKWSLPPLQMKIISLNTMEFHYG